MGMITFGKRRKGPCAAALHDARELRRRYGVNAEQWCEIGLLGPVDARQRKALEDIRAALKETPTV